jgi:hypothetical protein
MQRTGGVVSPYDGAMPPLPFLALLDLQQGMMRTDYQAVRLASLSHEERLALDDISAQTYIDRVMWTEWYVMVRLQSERTRIEEIGCIFFFLSFFFFFRIFFSVFL